MLNVNPLVSVVILTYNRMNELKNTLIKVFEQDYINIEIIVVDNASDDGTERMVKNDFPNIKYLKLVKNIGATGYNQGFEITSGKYVLVLDDDSYPLQYTLSKAVSMMENDEEIAVGHLNVFNTDIMSQKLIALEFCLFIYRLRSID